MGLQLSTRCRRDDAFDWGGCFQRSSSGVAQDQGDRLLAAPKDGDGIIWRELVNVFKENEKVCSDMITTMTSWAGRVLSCDYRQRRFLWRVARGSTFSCAVASMTR